MNANVLPSERAAVVATIDPDAYTASTYYSDWVDMSLFETIMAVFMTGDIGDEGEISGGLQQATDSSGTGAKAISGKTITALTNSPVDSDKQAIINLRGAELDVANSFRYVRMYLTNDQTSDMGGLILGMDPLHGPASDNDLASVDEIVS